MLHTRRYRVGRAGVSTWQRPVRSQLLMYPRPCIGKPAAFKSTMLLVQVQEMCAMAEANGSMQSACNHDMDEEEDDPVLDFLYLRSNAVPLLQTA